MDNIFLEDIYDYRIRGHDGCDIIKILSLFKNNDNNIVVKYYSNYEKPTKIDNLVNYIIKKYSVSEQNILL